MKSFVLKVLSFLATVASAAVAGMIVQYHWAIIGRTNLLRLVQGKGTVVPTRELIFPYAAIVILCLILAGALWLLPKSKKGEVQ